jgi:glucose/arabinose dehydrogenase
MRTAFLVAAVALAAATCRGQTGDGGPDSMEREMAAREARIADSLALPVSDSSAWSPIAVWVLPAELAEISGLTTMPGGLLLAHEDEMGRVGVVDPRKGSLVRRFSLGSQVRDDFEGITLVGDTVYMATSNGVLYRFRAGDDGAEVPHETRDTNLGKECEFEGVAFDSASSSLVLACKNVRVKALEDQLLFYRVSVLDASAAPVPLAIPLARAIGDNDWKSLHPSDITVDPATGHYIVIASQERAFLEITPAGEVVRSEPLPNRHRQPEGVAITRDGLLIVSDEARKGAASITLYRWRSRAASE